jgi:hypothetical protein
VLGASNAEDAHAVAGIARIFADGHSKIRSEVRAAFRKAVRVAIERVTATVHLGTTGRRFCEQW